jgi:hypothetical protein
MSKHSYIQATIHWRGATNTPGRDIFIRRSKQIVRTMDTITRRQR